MDRQEFNFHFFRKGFLAYVVSLIFFFLVLFYPIRSTFSQKVHILELNFGYIPELYFIAGIIIILAGFDMPKAQPNYIFSLGVMLITFYLWVVILLDQWWYGFGSSVDFERPKLSLGFLFLFISWWTSLMTWFFVFTISVPASGDEKLAVSE